jgi:arsenate reductase
VTKVLFVCVGNSCRSQMAEGFARAYGSDVLTPSSAGVAPAASVARDTVRAMDEKNINISAQFPKSVYRIANSDFDLIVNMSGRELSEFPGAMLEWAVDDPIGQPFEKYRTVRDDIEMRVMKLILDLRRRNGSTRA